MADSAAAHVSRRQVHMRRISCEGFARSDGLFDIEGTLIDTKPETTVVPEKHIDAGAPIHHMTVRLTIDRDFVIRDVLARTLDAPYGVCGDIAASYRQLVSLRIEAGFTRAVKRRFRGVLGCSHMTELLPPMATTAFQILWAEPGAFDPVNGDAGESRSSPLGGCHALRLDGEVVRTYFPQFPKASPP